MAKSEVVWYLLRLAGALFLCNFVGVMAQEEGSCYGSGSIALSVILTLIIGALVAVLVFLAWKKFVKAKKGQHLILETDPEKGKGEYAFDNPGFKDAGLTPVGKALEKTKTDSGSKTKWNQWSPLGVLTLKNEKKRTLDDSAIQDLHKIVTLRSHDFTGLGFNICGNMKDGIFIKDILHRGPAFESGKLNPGDRINSVTISFEHMVYEDALAILSYASPYEVVISAKSGKVINYPGPAGRPGHPIFRSSSTVDLSHMDKSSKKRLFQPDDSSDMGSNYSSLQKTRSNATTLERTKSKSPKPNQKPMKPKNRLSQDQLKQQLEQNIVEDYKETLRMKNEIESPKKAEVENQKGENKYQKFGVQVLPMERSPKSAELSQNDNNINLEKSEVVVPTDEVDKKAPPPVKKREKINFNREDPANNSGIKRDENNIPLEMPSNMMNAALAARKNRKSAAEEEDEEVKSPKKMKGKAPAPPESLKTYEGLKNLNKSDDSIEKMNYNSDSDVETDNQSSVNTIELNASDITVHQSEENEEKEKQNRKTASTGDLSKIKTRKTSTGTLERAQSLDITDTTMPQLAKKRKAVKIGDDYASKTSSDESLYGSALINKEPRLSSMLDGLNTFQRSRLKKSTEWGNLEDAILNLKQEPSPESSCEDIKSPEFDALVNKIKEIKEESEDKPVRNQIWPAEEEFAMKHKNDVFNDNANFTTRGVHGDLVNSTNHDWVNSTNRIEEDGDMKTRKPKAEFNEHFNGMPYNLNYSELDDRKITGIENARERKSGLFGENYRSSIDAIDAHFKTEMNDEQFESPEIRLSKNVHEVRKAETIEIKFDSRDITNTPGIISRDISSTPERITEEDLIRPSFENKNKEIRTEIGMKGNIEIHKPKMIETVRDNKEVSNVNIVELQPRGSSYQIKQEKEITDNINFDGIRVDINKEKTDKINLDGIRVGIKETTDKNNLEEIRVDVNKPKHYPEYSVNIKPVYSPRKSFESSKTILNESPRNLNASSNANKTEQLIKIKTAANEIAKEPEFNKNEETMGVKRIRDAPPIKRIEEETTHIAHISEESTNKLKNLIEIKTHPEFQESVEIKTNDDSRIAGGRNFIEMKTKEETKTVKNQDYIEIKTNEESKIDNSVDSKANEEQKSSRAEVIVGIETNKLSRSIQQNFTQVKNSKPEVIVGIKTNEQSRSVVPQNFIEMKTSEESTPKSFEIYSNENSPIHKPQNSIEIKTNEGLRLNKPQNAIEIKTNDGLGLNKPQNPIEINTNDGLRLNKPQNFVEVKENEQIKAVKRIRNTQPGISFEIKNGKPENSFEIKSIKTEEVKEFNPIQNNESNDGISEIKDANVKSQTTLVKNKNFDPEISSDETRYVEIKTSTPEVYKNGNYANKSMVYSHNDGHKPMIKDKIVKPDMSQVNSFILAEREASNKNLHDVKIVDTNVPDDLKVSRHSLGTLERGKRVNENVSNITISENPVKNVAENVKNLENVIVSTPDLIKNITIAEAIHDLNQVTIEGPSSLTFEIPTENDFKSHNGIKMKSNGDINKVEVGGDDKGMDNSLTYITEIQVETDSNKKNLDNDFEKYIKNFESNIKNFETNIHTFEQSIQGVAETAKKDVSSGVKSSVTVNEKVDAAKELQKVQEIVEEQLKKLPEMRFTTSSYESQIKQPEKRQSQIEILRSNFEKNTKPTKSEPSPPKSRIPVLNKTPPTSPERRDSKNLDTEADKEILEIMSSHIPMTSSLKYQPKTTRNVTVTSIRSNSKIPSGLPTFNSRPPVPPRKSTEQDEVQVATNGSESNFRQWVFNPTESITNITVTETKYSK